MNFCRRCIAWYMFGKPGFPFVLRGKTGSRSKDEICLCFPGKKFRKGQAESAESPCDQVCPVLSDPGSCLKRLFQPHALKTLHPSVSAAVGDNRLKNICYRLGKNGVNHRSVIKCLCADIDCKAANIRVLLRNHLHRTENGGFVRNYPFPAN